MGNARRSVMDGIKVIADGLVIRAEKSGDARIAPMVAKLYAALETKPDSYFVERLYPTSGTMDAAAPQKIWREVAAEVAKEG
jgi:hypothetical protein